MTKTPDEIKKGLAYCARLVCPLDECPFYKIEGSCALAKNLEALAYIQQLETTCHQLTEKVEQLERERDALMEEVRGKCWACKKGEPLRPGSSARICSLFDMEKRPCPHWEWRGVKEE